MEASKTGAKPGSCRRFVPHAWKPGKCKLCFLEKDKHPEDSESSVATSEYVTTTAEKAPSGLSKRRLDGDSKVTSTETLPVTGSSSSVAQLRQRLAAGMEPVQPRLRSSTVSSGRPSVRPKPISPAAGGISPASPAAATKPSPGAKPGPAARPRPTAISIKNSGASPVLARRSPLTPGSPKVGPPTSPKPSPKPKAKRVPPPVAARRATVSVGMPRKDGDNQPRGSGDVRLAAARAREARLKKESATTSPSSLPDKSKPSEGDATSVPSDGPLASSSDGNEPLTTSTTQTPTKEEQVMDVVEKEEDATMDASSPIKTTSSPLSADSAGQKTPSSSGRPSPAKRPKPSPSQKAASPLLGRAALPVVASKPRIMPTPPRSGGSSNRADILARLQAQGGGIPMPGFAMPMRPKATGVNGQTGNEDDNKEKEVSTADAPDGSTADEAGEGANSSQGSTATSPESQEPTTTHLLTVVQRFARPRRGGNRPPSREFRHSRADMATDEEYFFDSKAAGIGVLPDRPQPEMTDDNADGSVQPGENTEEAAASASTSAAATASGDIVDDFVIVDTSDVPGPVDDGGVLTPSETAEVKADDVADESKEKTSPSSDGPCLISLDEDDKNAESESASNAAAAESSPLICFDDDEPAASPADIGNEVTAAATEDDNDDVAANSSGPESQHEDNNSSDDVAANSSGPESQHEDNNSSADGSDTMCSSGDGFGYGNLDGGNERRQSDDREAEPAKDSDKEKHDTSDCMYDPLTNDESESFLVISSDEGDIV